MISLYAITNWLFFERNVKVTVLLEWLSALLEYLDLSRASIVQ